MTKNFALQKIKNLTPIIIHIFITFIFLFNNSCSVFIAKQLPSEVYKEKNLVSKEFLREELTSYPTYMNNKLSIKLSDKMFFSIKEEELTISKKEKNWIAIGLGQIVDYAFLLITDFLAGGFIIQNFQNGTKDLTLNILMLFSVGYFLFYTIYSLISLNSEVIASNEISKEYFKENILKYSQVKLSVNNKNYTGISDAQGVVTFSNILLNENSISGDITVLTNQNKEISGKVIF